MYILNVGEKFNNFSKLFDSRNLVKGVGSWSRQKYGGQLRQQQSFLSMG